MLKTAKVGQSWRLNRLTGDQVVALESHTEPVVRQPFTSPDQLSELEWQVLEQLANDVRVSSTDLARRFSVSPSTAYRTVQTLLQSEAVAPRVEVEPAALGFGLNVMIALQVDAGSIPSVLADLAAHQSSRMVSMVAGTASVISGGVFRNEAELSDFITDDIGALRGVHTMNICVSQKILRRYWRERDGFKIGEQIDGILRR
ncbi:Lrp/AsnC family transcriptional regulator [Rhodococcus sp. KBW08]|uniref:Lrp/AsnC family transcriptional regulator n=1 Tax=Rhodococcus sp. KBW08 TaxID=2144188 RepID=UPI0021AA3864|nr:Lrp/AsnC family transcriptional regulator [Rhodococcus sp. KBW08]